MVQTYRPKGVEGFRRLVRQLWADHLTANRGKVERGQKPEPFRIRLTLAKPEPPISQRVYERFGKLWNSRVKQ